MLRPTLAHSSCICCASVMHPSSRPHHMLTMNVILPCSFVETLLASDDSRDWVKISEMFLGPAPEQWSFLPKHKSNAYESQG
jgi:hypothetical protein